MTDDVTRPCAEIRVTERVHYFDGQMLTAEDFAAEQSYLIDKMRAHNRLLHGYGTVCGLGVVSTRPPSGSVVVEPGVALDCCGREIVLTDPVEVDLAEMLDDIKRSDVLYVTIAYQEVEAEPVPVGNGETAARRIREVARVGIAHTAPDGAAAPDGEDPVRPCPSCDDARVALATVRRSRSGTITASDIDNGIRRAVTPPCTVAPTDTSRPCRKKRLGAALVVGAISWAVLRRRTSGSPVRPE